MLGMVNYVGRWEAARMIELLDEIESAARHGLVRSTIGLPLTVPDICSGLEAQDGRTNGALYQAWFDTGLARAIAPRR